MSATTTRRAPSAIRDEAAAVANALRQAAYDNGAHQRLEDPIEEKALTRLLTLLDELVEVAR